MKYPSLKKLAKPLAALVSLALPMYTEAANVSLTASDASGTTSMNTVGKWGPDSTGHAALAPQATNDYFTGPYFVRTPTGTGGVTFAGHSLTLQDVSGNPGSGGQGAPYRSILYKGGGGDTITINNLTNAAGAVLNNGGSGNVTAPTFTGNLWTIAGNSTIISDQGATIIGYPIYGSANLTNSGSAQSGVHSITYTGNLSGFTGKLILFNLNGGMTVNLNSGSGNLGNPATFTPDQLTLGLGATLIDNVGIAFTNSNGGFTLTGNANISAASSTLIGEPITDVTNGVPSVSALTANGAGTLILSNANNTYSGGTTISSGIVQLGVNNAIPAPATAGDVTDNSIFDLNGHTATINGLNGAGTVDTTASSGTAALTVGANGDNGTFSGTIQNSSGTLSLIKIGAGTETLSAGFAHSGTTLVAGGTLALNTANTLPSTPGNLVVSNSATLLLDVSSGNSLPVNNLVFWNGTNVFSYGTVTANPAFPAINVAGTISAPGSSVVLNIAAAGLRVGTFTLVKYTGTPLASIANIQVSPPPGVAATLVNNTANHSLDLQITAIPNVLTWNGVNGTAWDLSTPNWTNPATGGITLFQQYTNNGVVAGDAVTFDDTLTNDFVNPQPTNIVLNSTFYAFPVVVNSTLPYTIAGAGGIAGPTSLLLSNTGTLTLLTSNTFSGGVNVSDTSLIITNDSALGAAAGPVTLNGGSIQYNGSTTNNVRAFTLPVASTIDVSGNNTVRLGGPLNAAGVFYKADTGTLILAHNDPLVGSVFLHGGTTIIDTGGAVTNANYDDVGQDTNDSATLTIRGTGSFSTTSDFNLGDLGASVGTLNMQGTATLTMNAFFIGSANASGSTAMGTVNQSGGTITQVSTGVGEFCIGGRTSPTSVGIYNMSGGTLTANAGVRIGSTGAGTLTQSGGIIFAKQGINIARIAGSYGTNNLNGGTLSAYNVASSTGTNAVFNFNGGTLQANFSPPNPWFSGSILTYVQAGGAVIDSSNNSVTISTPLLAGSPNGGLTKLGTGTLILTGTNTFTGPITNNAGTLFLNSASTYAGGAVVNAGTLQITAADAITGGTVIGNNAVVSFAQQGSAPASIGNLTLNGSANGQGATLALTQATANNPAIPLLSCQTLTLNGTNSINLAAAQVGTLALIKYTGTIAGSGNCTNLILPQGGIGYISNNAVASTLYAVVTSTGPGLVWTGTNAAAPNTWNINATTNWLVSSIPTSYHQIITPGDAVTFNDSGSPTVIVNTNVAPASMVISNNIEAYTFSGSGTLSGPVSLQKLGSGTAILHLTNNSSGNTVISNGTVQLGGVGVLSSSGNLVMGTAGTLELSGVTTTVGELIGGGTIDNNSGINVTLTVGTSSGGIWNGTIRDHNAGGVALDKVGSGTWVIGGTNTFDDGQPFTDLNQINAGTVIVTNGGVVQMSTLQFEIANGAGNTAAVVIAGGTLAVSNNVLSVGYSTNATGSLTVNSGTVVHTGSAAGAGFAAVANSIDVGAQGAVGTLTVNGGQVLNSLPLYLGDGSTSSGTLQLNGGLVQASQVTANGSPTASIANFNSGTLQATTNSADFIDASTTANIQSGGLILDDGGWAITLPNPIQSDPTLLGGGMIKQGAGAVYLDATSTYTGTTLVTNGLLAGIGGVDGPLVVAPAGNLGAGDAAGIGSFYVYNNLVLQGNATLRINVTGGVPSQDQVVVSGNITYGGILTVTNVTTDSTLLANGNTFQLFSVTGTPTGNFSRIAGSPGAGLGYSFNPASGILSVITQTIAPNPTNITVNVSGSTLSLSWPTDHLGWILQSQTNSLSAGLSNNWSDVAGTSTVTSTNLTINPKTPTAFFRLRHP